MYILKWPGHEDKIYCVDGIRKQIFFLQVMDSLPFFSSTQGGKQPEDTSPQAYLKQSVF